MLFAYTFKRSTLDEINDSVCAFLRLLVGGSRAGKAFTVAKCCSEPLRSRAASSAVLRSKLRTFYVAYLALPVPDQQAVYRAFILTNQIARQLAGTAQRYCLSDLPLAIQQPTSELFKELYGTAPTPLQWKAHWAEFYNRTAIKVCPFCGIERLNHPILVKQDYDHILCKKVYPFSAVNCRNLVPAGTECNRIFKHEQDVIFSAGARRRAFNPFRDHGAVISVDLTGSKKPDPGLENGVWSVKMLPDSEEVRTWAHVFKLSTRYAKNVFEQDYATWRDDFVSWSVRNCPVGHVWVVANVRATMQAYCGALENNRLHDARFLKHALFKFLLDENDPAFFAALTRQMESEQTKRQQAV